MILLGATHVRVVRSTRNNYGERSILVQGLLPESRNTVTRVILANNYNIVSNSKSQTNELGGAPAIKVIVLRDYFELSGPSRYRTFGSYNFLTI